MRCDLDFLGAESGLRDQYIVVRVRSIDEAKARQALHADEGWRAPVAAAALSLIDVLPKAALDVALPAAAGVLKTRYGVDAEVSVASAKPEARGRSEFWPGLAVGGGLVGALALVYSLARRFF